MTNNNKRCLYCDKEIFNSELLVEDTVLFCSHDCYMWQGIEDD